MVDSPACRPAGRSTRDDPFSHRPASPSRRAQRRRRRGRMKRAWGDYNTHDFARLAYRRRRPMYPVEGGELE